VELPPGIYETVARRLAIELGDRGLLLAPEELDAAELESTHAGGRLLALLLRRCYGDDAPAVEFGSDAIAARVEGALAFGAATARVLASAALDLEQELICATFNLGIGLVDSLCDGDPATGAALLETIARHDMAGAVDAPRERGWLRDALASALADDPAAAFSADVVEAFFATLHLAYPGATPASLRRAVAAQLGAALEAERRSVAGTGGAARDELIACSRATSVLPFEIIEALATGATTAAGTDLGEAMWRIDDLVDLGQDARTGALNAILLEAATPDDLRETIQLAAAEAAEKLDAVIVARDGREAFLAFVQRYAGVGL
jgi:hypothetical protein